MDKKVLYPIMLSLSFFFATTSLAQQVKPDDPNPTRMDKGDISESYLMFSRESFSEAKKYIILQFHHENIPLSEEEKSEIELFQKNMTAKNTEVHLIKWKNAKQLQEALKNYNVSVKASGQNKLEFTNMQYKGSNNQYTTLTGNAILVLEDGVPLSLCAAPYCWEKLKSFFKLNRTF